MRQSDDASTIYECVLNNGEEYSFRYPDPETRNGGKTFSGVAVVWKLAEPEKTFTVPFFVKADEIDRKIGRAHV